MDWSRRRQKVLFDRSAIDACMGYLRNRNNENLERLISTPGSKLAYAHHRWSSISSRLTIQEFWKKELERINWNKQLEASIEEIIERLSGHEGQCLHEALRYLPRGHVFNTTVYLIGGYDNIVYGEDVALNLIFNQFHTDHREAVYYLVHELAHAGYFRYNRMPEFANLKTLCGLLDAVKLLTHLEGMGVISPFRRRMKEDGLLDSDYKVLLNEDERNARVREYFTMLSRLENEPNRKLSKEDYRILENFSMRPKRLWYIAGGHMALKIEERYGTEILQNIVKKGHEAFFRTYTQIENLLPS
jgi:hypothetical protein